MARPRTDLIITAVVACAAFASTFLPESFAGLKTVLVGPRVLMLPGYALAAAALPRSLAALERLLFSLGLSLALAVLGGLLLNLTATGLDSTSWAWFFFSVTLVGCAVAAYRQRSLTPDFSSEFSAPMRVPWPQAAMLGAALALALSAIWVAQLPAPEAANQAYTQLWAVPSDSAGGATGHIQLGVKSMEATTESFTLRLVVGGETAQEFSLSLAPTDTWQADVQIPSGGGGSVEAILYRSEAPEVEYRRVLVRSSG